MKQDYLNKPDFLKIPEDPFDQNTKINNPKNNPINKKFDNINTQMKEFKNYNKNIKNENNIINNFIKIEKKNLNQNILDKNKENERPKDVYLREAKEIINKYNKNKQIEEFEEEIPINWDKNKNISLSKIEKSSFNNETNILSILPDYFKENFKLLK